MLNEYFQLYNRYLVGLAYRMLGSVDDAEEVAQESFLRYQTAGEPELDEPRGWFTRVCTRICLDRIKRLSTRMENYPGQWLPEPYVEPVEQAAIDETLSMALMAGLQQLSSSERAVFLLHDIFDFHFSQISEMLELTASNCRQLAVRARRKIRQTGSTQNEKDIPELQRITEAFLLAVRNGDADQLRSVLADEVKLKSDGGGKVPAVHYPLLGRHKVQTFLLRAVTPMCNDASVQISIRWFNGAPGLITQSPHQPANAYQLQIESGKIAAIFVQRNPDKLHRLLENNPAQ